MITTLRKILNDLRFDWENGEIIYQKTKDRHSPDSSEIIDAQIIDENYDVLDKKFNDGYEGGVGCPRFIARDKEALYFPVRYDGATWGEKIYINIKKYLDYKTERTPYPGGG